MFAWNMKTSEEEIEKMKAIEKHMLDDPKLIYENFMGEFLSQYNDKANRETKCFWIRFAAKVCDLLLFKYADKNAVILLKMSFLLEKWVSDKDLIVLKEALRLCSKAFPVLLNFCFMPISSTDKISITEIAETKIEMIKLLSNIKATVFPFLKCDNIGIRLLAIKFIECLLICFSPIPVITAENPETSDTFVLNRVFFIEKASFKFIEKEDSTVESFLHFSLPDEVMMMSRMNAFSEDSKVNELNKSLVSETKQMLQEVNVLVGIVIEMLKTPRDSYSIYTCLISVITTLFKKRIVFWKFGADSLFEFFHKIEADRGVYYGFSESDYSSFRLLIKYSFLIMFQIPNLNIVHQNELKKILSKMDVNENFLNQTISKVTQYPSNLVNQIKEKHLSKSYNLQTRKRNVSQRGKKIAEEIDDVEEKIMSDSSSNNRRKRVKLQKYDTIIGSITLSQMTSTILSAFDNVSSSFDIDTDVHRDTFPTKENLVNVISEMIHRANPIQPQEKSILMNYINATDALGKFGGDQNIVDDTKNETNVVMTENWKVFDPRLTERKDKASSHLTLHSQEMKNADFVPIIRGFEEMSSSEIDEMVDEIWKSILEIDVSKEGFDTVKPCIILRIVVLCEEIEGRLSNILLDYITSDVKNRVGLALQWLYLENILVGDKQRYSNLFVKVFSAIMKSSHRSDVLMRFVTECPSLDISFVIQSIVNEMVYSIWKQENMQNEIEECKLGLFCLGSIVRKRKGKCNVRYRASILSALEFLAKEDSENKLSFVRERDFVRREASEILKSLTFFEDEDIVKEPKTSCSIESMGIKLYPPGEENNTNNGFATSLNN